MSQKTIYFWLKKYKELGDSCFDENNKSSKSILNDHILTEVSNLRDEGYSVREIIEKLNLDIAVSTLSRYLKEKRDGVKYSKFDSNLVLKLIISKIIPFSTFFQNCVRIKKNLFLITTVDISSGWFHLSFTKENSVIYKSIASDYLITSFKKYGIEITRDHFHKSFKEYQENLNSRIKNEFFRLTEDEINKTSDLLKLELNRRVRSLAEKFTNSLSAKDSDEKKLLAKALIFQIGNYNKTNEDMKWSGLYPETARNISIETEQKIPYIFNLGSISPIFTNKYLSIVDLRNSSIGYFVLNDEEIEEIYELTLKYLEESYQSANKEKNSQKMLDIIDQKLSLITIKSSDVVFKALHEKGKLLQIIGKWSEAESILKELISIAEKENRYIELLEFFSEYAKLLHNKGLNTDSIVILKKAINLAESHKVHLQIAELNYQLGSYLLDNNEYSKVIMQINKIYEHKSRFKDKKLFELKALNLIGDYHYKKREYFQARLRFTKLKILSAKYNQEYSLSCALGNLGIIYQIEENYDKALDLINQKMIISKKENNYRQIAKSHSEMGNIYYKIKKNDKAIKHYNEALSISIEKEFNLCQFQALTGLGALYLRINKPNKAIGYYTNANTAINKTQYSDFKIRALYNLGRTYYSFLKQNKQREEDLNNCRKYFNAAYNLHLKVYPNEINTPILAKIHDYLKKIF